MWLVFAPFIWSVIGVILMTQSLVVLLRSYGVDSGVGLLWSLLTAWFVAFKMVAPLNEHLRGVLKAIEQDPEERRALIRKMFFRSKGWSALFFLSILPYFIYFCLTAVLLSMLNLALAHKIALLWLSASFNLTQIARLVSECYTEFGNILSRAQGCDVSDSACQLCRIFPVPK